MGCDIHTCVDYIDPATGQYKLFRRRRLPCDYCNGTGESIWLIKCANCGKVENKVRRERGGKPMLEFHGPDRKCLFGPRSYQPIPEACNPCRGAKIRLREVYVGRSYTLFGVLAGVRGTKLPGFTEEPRGYAPDVSWRYKAMYPEDSDFHSHSWYTLAELQKAKADWTDNFQWTLDYLATLNPDATKVRLLFCFDN